MPEGPPYFFLDAEDRPKTSTVGRYVYLDPNGTYVFPTGHTYPGSHKGSELPPMWRDLLRLMVRLDYDEDRFLGEYVRHGITELALPFTSARVRMSQAWVYYNKPKNPDNRIHFGLDFNDGILSLPRTNFEVVAAADGTLVGWDPKVGRIALEHVSENGRRFRTLYGHLHSTELVPDDSDQPAKAVFPMGRLVQRGERVGLTGMRDTESIHLHWMFALPSTIPDGWTPDPPGFQTWVEQRWQGRIEIPWPGRWNDSWAKTEWFFFDPFGIYDRLRPTYPYIPGYQQSCFYYPVTRGPGTYAFGASTESPHQEDRIPYFSAVPALRDDLAVGPISLGAMSVLGE